mmetsp:Transcript_72768/g.157937  ORF Transcript_72768/g.157937 Transcript_72768/m.157937 type:complete len:129 (-) Transcript_72768:18-404(-)
MLSQRKLQHHHYGCGASDLNSGGRERQHVVITKRQASLGNQTEFAMVEKLESGCQLILELCRCSPFPATFQGPFVASGTDAKEKRWHQETRSRVQAARPADSKAEFPICLRPGTTTACAPSQAGEGDA